MTDMAVINFPRKYAFFAENGPIEKTVTSYKNHEFIPPGRKTIIFLQTMVAGGFKPLRPQGMI
jgi:hypothetical protein